MLDDILSSACEKIAAASDLKELDKIRIEFFGKSGVIGAELKKLGSYPEEQRKEYGSKVNNLKEEVKKLIDKKFALFEAKEELKRLEEDRIDVSAPSFPHVTGKIHPISECMREMIAVFAKYGFEIKEGPNIEDDWHNFTALNIAPDHPARQMHDTFYLKSKKGEEPKVLRTHTSSVQIRTMENSSPPFRFIAPGRTYRSDSDATHTPMFHQIEGVVIEKNIHMGHLKYLIKDFIQTFFEQPGIEIRFRPSFFPFTEPSAEVDIRMDKKGKFLEVLGCGAVHPQVLKNLNIDPEVYSGFAFGLGVERFAMLKYGINDLRQFFEGDLRRLKHYGFSPFAIPSLAGGLTK